MESRAPPFDRDPMSSIGIGGFEKTRQGVPFSASVPRIDFLRALFARWTFRASLRARMQLSEKLTGEKRRRSENVAELESMIIARPLLHAPRSPR